MREVEEWAEQEVPFRSGVPRGTPEPDSALSVTSPAASTGRAEPAAGVPRSTRGGDPLDHPGAGGAAPQADPALAEALDRELAQSEAFWARLTKNGIYDTEEQLRDAIDRPG